MGILYRIKDEIAHFPTLVLPSSGLRVGNESPLSHKGSPSVLIYSIFHLLLYHNILQI